MVKTVMLIVVGAVWGHLSETMWTGRGQDIFVSVWRQFRCSLRTVRGLLGNSLGSVWGQFVASRAQFRDRLR